MKEKTYVDSKFDEKLSMLKRVLPVKTVAMSSIMDNCVISPPLVENSKSKNEYPDKVIHLPSLIMQEETLARRKLFVEACNDVNKAKETKMPPKLEMHDPVIVDNEPFLKVSASQLHSSESEHTDVKQKPVARHVSSQNIPEVRKFSYTNFDSLNPKAAIENSDSCHLFVAEQDSAINITVSSIKESDKNEIEDKISSSASKSEPKKGSELLQNTHLPSHNTNKKISTKSTVSRKAITNIPKTKQKKPAAKSNFAGVKTISSRVSDKSGNYASSSSSTDSNVCVETNNLEPNANRCHSAGLPQPEAKCTYAYQKNIQLVSSTPIISDAYPTPQENSAVIKYQKKLNESAKNRQLANAHKKNLKKKSKVKTEKLATSSAKKPGKKKQDESNNPLNKEELSESNLKSVEPEEVAEQLDKKNNGVLGVPSSSNLSELSLIPENNYEESCPEHEEPSIQINSNDTKDNQDIMEQMLVMEDENNMIYLDNVDVLLSESFIISQNASTNNATENELDEPHSNVSSCGFPGGKVVQAWSEFHDSDNRANLKGCEQSPAAKPRSIENSRPKVIYDSLDLNADYNFAYNRIDCNANDNLATYYSNTVSKEQSPDECDSDTSTTTPTPRNDIVESAYKENCVKHNSLNGHYETTGNEAWLEKTEVNFYDESTQDFEDLEVEEESFTKLTAEALTNHEVQLTKNEFFHRNLLLSHLQAAEHLSSQQSDARSDYSVSSGHVHAALEPTAITDLDMEKCSGWTQGPLIGQGAFGTVWQGMTSEGHLIAIKQVELSLCNRDAALKEYSRLQREVNILKDMRHSNIVSFLGTCLEGNVVKIFMEYLSGGSINNILKSYGPLQEVVLKRYTKQILEGVTFLHDHNVIHRDINGNNVMLLPSGVIKLIDFGCAKRLQQRCASRQHSRQGSAASSVDKTVQHSDGCHVNSFAGTPYWMSPEIITGKVYGPKADIWSIGCTVIEMATAKPPLHELGPMPAMFHIGEGRPMPDLPPRFSKHARKFVTRCLSYEIPRRPSARELLKHRFVLHSQS